MGSAIASWPKGDSLVPTVVGVKAVFHLCRLSSGDGVVFLGVVAEMHAPTINFNLGAPFKRIWIPVDPHVATSIIFVEFLVFSIFTGINSAKLRNSIVVTHALLVVYLVFGPFVMGHCPDDAMREV